MIHKIFSNTIVQFWFKANFYGTELWNFGWSNKTFFYEILPKSDDPCVNRFVQEFLIIQEFDRNIEILNAKFKLQNIEILV